MVKKFCPSCYHENPPEKKVCEKCGAPLEGGHHEDFLTKLIWAVQHPEPETRLRAAVVRALGRMEERPDILLKALKGSSFLVRLA
ncbi:zinc-ribbon domain-containing protein [Desulfothermobacter acidiphilus]|uniref:zinc-ribbon domain-containing protein n=1 Tax=Desulfothermobacter acidiphilus TaxID=1938353 RepID=UPI003F8A46E0